MPPGPIDERRRRPPISSILAVCALAVGMLIASVAAASAAPTVCVVNRESDSVTPIEVATNTAGTPIPVGDSPRGIAATPDGRKAYVADGDSNTVTPIDLVTNTPGTPIAVGRFPLGVAITPDGATAYVTNVLSDTVTPSTWRPTAPAPRSRYRSGSPRR